MRFHSKSLAILFVSFMIVLPTTGWTAPLGATATALVQSGSSGKKKDLVVIGDGFQAGQQANFNSFVDQLVIRGSFAEGPLMEDMNAFNITRINVNSTDSGVTQIQEVNTTRVPDVPADGTRLDFKFSGGNAAPVPTLSPVRILDPNGRKITDKGQNKGTLKDSNGIVSGSFNYTTGEVTLKYTGGNAPPAGNFTIVTADVSTSRNTALDYRFSGSWDRCWEEGGPNTDKTLNSILDALVPGRDYVVVILNESGFGGCGWASGLSVTMNGGWPTLSHEMGHMVGRLCDEYQGSEHYTGGEPGCVNMTKNTNRSSLKWRDFVNPATPIPTSLTTPGIDQAETAGLFEGGSGSFATGIYRPHVSARMSSNAPHYGPVAYNRMKEVLAGSHEHTFQNTVTGDFDGDGRADLVIHNANALELYLSDGTHEQARWTQAAPLGVWDYFRKNDQFLVGDFNGDGRDDLFVYNLVDYSIAYFGLLRSITSPSGSPPVLGFDAVVRYDEELPGWDKMKRGDRFYVADFDADGKDDIYVTSTNRTDWAVGYLGMLRSTGSGLEMTRRYDEMLPGWDKIMPNDKFFVANLDGQGGQDLFVFNVGNWKMGYLMSLISSGTELLAGARYNGSVPGWDKLKGGDQFFVADFDGDADDDLYVFNGSDWRYPYLGVIRSIGGGAVDVPMLHENAVPGWDKLKPHDRFFTANVDGQGGKDLFILNASDWGDRHYLGALLAYPDGFRGRFQEGWIGGWKVQSGDVIYIGNFDGTLAPAPATDDIIVQNGANDGNGYLGLLRNDGYGGLSSSAVYYRWIHHYLYHSSGRW